MKPALSVLMPVFNTESYLEHALQSISKQSFGDFEFIVIDDGSTDRSTAILQNYSRREPRMRIISRENKGIVATRNELLSAARAELVAWMDSDDVSDTRRLELQMNMFAADSNLVCVGTFAQCVDPDGNNLCVEKYPSDHHEILEAQKLNGGMRFPTTMMKRSAAIEVGGFRSPFRIGEDFDLLLRLSEVGSMANLSTVLYIYRQHIASTCAQLGPSWINYRDAILSLAKERQTTGKDRLQRGEAVEIQAVKVPTKRHLLAEAYSYWAKCALANSNPTLARRYSRSAIISNPSSLQVWRTALKVAFH